MVLEVGIIGAGIAGLAAGLGLRRAGHNVEIFETSTLNNEIGAAITITPNGTRVLDRWDFDHAKAGAVETMENRMLDHVSLKPVATNREAFARVRARFGHPFNQYHRVDLHEGLKSLAEGTGQPGRPVKLRKSRRVVDVDVENGVITLEGGETTQKDLVVIANGIKSTYASKITGKPEPLHKNGRSAFRALVPFEKIKERPDLYKYFENEKPGFMVPFSMEDHTYVVTYPCRSKTVLNVALVHPTRNDQQDADDWHSPASVDDMLDITRDFHPDVHEMLKLAPEVKVFTMFKKNPLSRLMRGRAVIIGDAAHPLQPTHAQGGVLTLEEGAALEAVFSGDVQGAAEVERRLGIYDEAMLNHVQVVHYLSECFPFQQSYEWEQAVKLSKKPVYPISAMQFSEPVQEFFYGFDAFGEAKAALEKFSS